MEWHGNTGFQVFQGGVRGYGVRQESAGERMGRRHEFGICPVGTAGCGDAFCS